MVTNLDDTLLKGKRECGCGVAWVLSSTQVEIAHSSISLELIYVPAVSFSIPYKNL